MATEKKYFFVINPHAGKQKAEKLWTKIEIILQEKKINYFFYFTKKRGDAPKIIVEKINEGFRNFVVIGGDGTLNEAVNGIFSQKIVDTKDIYLGLFSVGTGNDWARYFGIKQDINAAVQRLLSNSNKKQDVGKVSYTENGKAKEVYFLNIAGLGIDANIVASTEKIQQRGNRLKIAYFISLLKCFITFKPQLMKISIAGEVLENKFLSLSVGNGKFSGGGMCQTPDALIDDGFFDISLYSNISKLKMMTSTNKLYNNTIKSLKGIRCFREKNFLVEYENDVLIECDGELFVGNNFNFSIIPLAINILV